MVSKGKDGLYVVGVNIPQVEMKKEIMGVKTELTWIKKK
jgi:hypothetical protein